MFFNVLTVVIRYRTATNKYTRLRTKCVVLCQTVVVASAPFRDLPRKLTWEENFMLTEKKREATHLSSRGEKDGSKGQSVKHFTTIPMVPVFTSIITHCLFQIRYISCYTLTPAFYLLFCYRFPNIPLLWYCHIFQCIYMYIYTYMFMCVYTECSQKNGAVSKINKKFISHLTRAKRTPSAAATVQVSHALITILQCVHPGSHDTHPHGNQIHPRLGVACPL
jgi:hypothetical protein